MSPTYHIWTIGCQMNEADSRALASRLEAIGFAPAPSPQQADLVVLNTCVVRQQAEDKIYDQLQHVKGIKRRAPNTIAALMGCLVAHRPDTALKERFPFVDVLIPPFDPRPLLEYLRSRGVKTDPAAPDPVRYGNLPLSRRGTTATAFVPVVLGCSQACAFCVVPRCRGPERSRPAGDILEEVRRLVEQGVREITLLGQIVDRYGLDLGDGQDIAGLLRDVSSVDGLLRVRFLTSHPSWFTDRLLDAVAELPRVCPHIELPVQSGNNEMLALMRRGYTVEDYRRLVDRLRARRPDLGLSTDVIVGFPGETEAAFLDTYRLMEELAFDMAHIAKYSPRPDTPAARTMVDDVPEPEKERRRRALEDLLADQLARRHRALVGTRLEVLAEERQKNGRWRGRTPQNKIVFFEDDRDWLGRVADVTIDWAGPFSMVGHVEKG